MVEEYGNGKERWCTNNVILFPKLYVASASTQLLQWSSVMLFSFAIHPRKDVLCIQYMFATFTFNISWNHF